MRTACRFYTHHRSLAAVATLTIAVTLGLAAALASTAQAILFRPLPVARAYEIVRVFTVSDTQPLGLVSYPDFEDFRASSRAIRGMAAQSQVLLAVGKAPAQMRLGLAVTANYFDLLGVGVAPGRGFAAGESRDALCVLAYDFWQSRFGGDARVLGKTILLRGAPFTIIGVAPKNFGLDRFTHEDFYFPIGVYATGLLPGGGVPLQDRSRRYLNVYGRLEKGASVRRADAEIAAIARCLAAQYPEDRANRAAVLTELAARASNDRTMPALAALLAALAALIAMVASANLALVFAARAEARAREISIRIALGATPACLIRENLSESAAVTLTGSAAAVPVAYAAQRILGKTAVLPTDIRFSIAPRLDAGVFLALAATGVLLAAGCAFVPPQQTARGVKHALAAIEIALATALISCSVFLLGGIQAATRADPGYRTRHVLVLALDPSQVGFTEARSRAFYDQALARVRAISGVKSAELAQSIPLGYTAAQRQIVLGDETLTLWVNIVGPRYFDLLHLPIVEGRGFTEGDSPASAPVAIVNQELARRCGVGCTFRMSGRQIRVVGVARSIAYFSPNEPPRPYFYLPFSQNYTPRMILHVETAGDPAAMAHAAADEIHRLDPAQPISEIRPMSDYLRQGAMFQARIALCVLGFAAIAGIPLALTGLAGLIAQASGRRRREIAIRIALGARRSAILRLLAVDGLKALVSGIAAGGAMGACAMRLFSHLLPARLSFGSSALAVGFVVIASLPAFLLPARKACFADPSILLRAE
ncbi:MAG TPA: ABC transporter permease [Bryobacteraceae bacterium]|nr:ABC transporter permease [Bryobacteraceae bacterium]